MQGHMHMQAPMQGQQQLQQPGPPAHPNYANIAGFAPPQPSPTPSLGAPRRSYGSRRLCQMPHMGMQSGRRPQYNARGEVQPPEHAFTLGTDWRTGLFSCAKDLGGTCSTLWCPQCQLGYQSHRLHKFYPDMDMAVCCGTCCADFFLLGCGSPAMTCILRGKIARRYKLEEGIVGRFFKGCCCWPCALCQHHREMAIRGEYCGGACLARDVPLPPAAVPPMGASFDKGPMGQPALPSPAGPAPGPAGPAAPYTMPGSHPGLAAEPVLGTMRAEPAMGMPMNRLSTGGMARPNGGADLPRQGLVNGGVNGGANLEVSVLGANTSAGALPAHLGFVQSQQDHLATLSLAASTIVRVPAPHDAPAPVDDASKLEPLAPLPPPQVSQQDVVPADIAEESPREAPLAADVTRLSPRTEKCRPPPLSCTNDAGPRPSPACTDARLCDGLSAANAATVCAGVRPVAPAAEEARARSASPEPTTA